MSAPRTPRGLAAAIVEACANRQPLLGLIELYGDARIEQERARLVAGVEGLPGVPDPLNRSAEYYPHVARADVIARIGSIATDGSECPLCGGVGRIFDITEDVNRALGEGKLLLSPLIRDTEGGTE